MSLYNLQEELQIHRITEDFEKEAKELVLKGLKERFGSIDSRYNPDLNSILESYSGTGAVFLIGVYKSQVVCTGAITFETAKTGRVERMSVRKEFRGTGVAARMIRCLEAWAKQLGYQRLILETNNEWHSAVEFYKKHGYTLYLDDGECSHFVKDLV